MAYLSKEEIFKIDWYWQYTVETISDLRSAPASKRYSL
ncbi:hypothetical protein SDC9_59787 [bioreactor metagenome]|uniref:Uncharacterized protein n=1 Tax=bioreactor metagenome TaxID=1076179 RepID=A0A644XB32_9ZZZZ